MLFLSSGFLSGCKRSHQAKKKSRPQRESNPRSADLIVRRSSYRLSYEARREQVVDNYGGTDLRQQGVAQSVEQQTKKSVSRGYDFQKNVKNPLPCNI